MIQGQIPRMELLQAILAAVSITDINIFSGKADFGMLANSNVFFKSDDTRKLKLGVDTSYEGIVYF